MYDQVLFRDPLLSSLRTNKPYRCITFGLLIGYKSEDKLFPSKKSMLSDQTDKQYGKLCSTKKNNLCDQSLRSK